MSILLNKNVKQALINTLIFSFAQAAFTLAITIATACIQSFSFVENNRLGLVYPWLTKPMKYRGTLHLKTGVYGKNNK
ncbi:hypothetical protein ATY35_18260 [Vibrio cidicii]|uniref:Uncharacterized protein n=1 Tax=Vibrio cidicii TaxID=1763883 RepID=A0A151KW20_9VIBR|nr:hypothetical protein ATY36_17205 [Vibrio cidicii]KYN84387.1 hypothetical protein ATY35_18260 [Vibrio cidicii]KYN86662.1 hypothetical protein ATY37_19450 [Vibrio cidicii]